MKKLTITSMIIALAAPLSAETHTDRENMIRSRDLTGGEIYTTNVDGDMNWDRNTAYDMVDDNWENIGEIEDLILDREGQMIGVIAEVGGFLDIGDKHVFIALDGISLVPVDDRAYSIVTGLSKDELMKREDLDEGFWD